MITGHKRVFAALDAGDTQRRVAEKAILVAANNKASLCFGHVVDSVYSEASPEDRARLAAGVEQDIRADIGDLLEEAEGNADIQEVELRVVAGGLLETLHHEVIDDFGPDLVICCKRGFSGLKYAFVGSVSTYLIRNLTCDVLVVGLED